jgi:hypothetical protein
MMDVSSGRLRARMLIENPEDVVVELKVALTARDWAALRDQLHTCTPKDGMARDFANTITNLLVPVRKIVWAEDTSS